MTAEQQTKAWYKSVENKCHWLGQWYVFVLHCGFSCSLQRAMDDGQIMHSGYHQLMPISWHLQASARVIFYRRTHALTPTNDNNISHINYEQSQLTTDRHIINTASISNLSLGSCCMLLMRSLIPQLHTGWWLNSDQHHVDRLSVLLCLSASDAPPSAKHTTRVTFILYYCTSDT